MKRDVIFAVASGVLLALLLLALVLAMMPLDWTGGL